MADTNCSLTVFLGGAGMVGDYNADMVVALQEVGIHNPVYGNYSAFTQGLDKYIFGTLDMLGDAAAVVFYNQDKNDPSILKVGDPNKCALTYNQWEKYRKNSKVTKEVKIGGFTLYKVRKMGKLPNKPDICNKPGARKFYFLSISKKIHRKMVHASFSLADLEIKKTLPKCGQFNIIGYSWGAIIAARSAVYHADIGVTVDHLVLIGAPINKSLLKSVRTNSQIKKVIIINLSDHGDPLFAGITDEMIIKSAARLGKQMTSATGHFYYSATGGTGQTRRRKLVKRLYNEGLR